MGIKSFSLAATALVLSTNVNAAIISTDWLTSGDNLITQDTDSGLEWLDLTATLGRSYNDISSKFSTGNEFSGWRYATSNELAGFWDAFGGDSAFYDGWSTVNNGIFSSMAPIWGDLYCNVNTCNPGDGYSTVILSDVITGGIVVTALAYNKLDNSNSAHSDMFDLNFGGINKSTASLLNGSALVRDISAVPVPSAVWLFGSGLIGLIGVARRKA